MRRTILSLLRVFPALLVLGAGMQRPDETIPTPSEFLRINIGADGVLATYDEIAQYWKAVDGLSDRVTVQELGKTTMGRPYVVAIVTSPDNQKRVDEYRAINARLYDARKTSEREAQQLIAQGKTIVAMQMGIHSDEVGAPQLSLELAYRFATENTPRMRRVLGNTIIILSPSHNPDGTQLVAEWNKKTLRTPFEGGPLPFLYQPYVGHDNNRDWYMFTQQESRLTVTRIWNVWHPQISYDLHQMGEDGARIFMPPYAEPADPNIDPILLAQTDQLGSYMAADLLGRGKEGVLTHALYDLWTPARAYADYHGGVRILTEVASGRLASPVAVPFSMLRGGIGYDAQRASSNFPRPWRGGTWRLRDIIDYEHAAVDAVLDHAAGQRQSWLTNFWRVNRNAIGRIQPATGKPRPYAVVIPAAQRDPAAAFEMMRALQLGDVEFHRARSSFLAGGKRYPAGSHVILMAQPASAFANSLTEIQHYPDRRSFPGGPPQAPYDVTAYTMPLLMGADVIRISEPFEADLELLSSPVSAKAGSIIGGRARTAYAFAHDSAGILALIRLTRDKVPVEWARAPFEDSGQKYPTGTIIVPVAGSSKIHDQIAAIVAELPVAAHALRGPAPAALTVRLPRVGLYKSYIPSIDEGWTRWIFEQWRLPYATVENRDVTRGGEALRARFDVLVLPDQSPNEIVNGFGPGRVPPEYAGGIGDAGVAALRGFVERGGTLVALDSASLLAIQRFNLPVRNIVSSVSARDLYGPGSILRSQVDIEHPIGFGSPAEGIAWFEHSPAFQLSGRARAVVTYPAAGPPLLSGWLLGGEHLNGAAAVVEVPMGAGRVILFGFRPQYRAQTWATFGLFFNSLFYSTISQQ